MSRTRLVIALALTLLGTSVPVAVAAPDEVVALLAYRTTTRGASLQLTVSTVPGRETGFIASALVSVEDSRLTSVDLAGAVLTGTADQVQVTRDGERTALCDHGVCHADQRTMASMMGLSTWTEAGEDGYNAVLVLAKGARVRWSAKTDGWAVRRVPTYAHRFVSGQQAGEVGAYGLGSGVEAFTDASLPGGRYGSIGLAAPPCSQADVAVARGVGSVTLEGGETTPSFTCPASRVRLASWADGRTTWRLHGVAVGDTSMADGRLFVLDLPKRLAFPARWPWR